MPVPNTKLAARPIPMKAQHIKRLQQPLLLLREIHPCALYEPSVALIWRNMRLARFE